jgi:hypothetical protein
MLGRRAAVVGAVAALAVGGGSALAATHGGSHSTPKAKPAPKAHRLYHPAKIPARIRKLNHCSQMHGVGAMGTMPGV